MPDKTPADFGILPLSARPSRIERRKRLLREVDRYMRDNSRGTSDAVDLLQQMREEFGGREGEYNVE